MICPFCSQNDDKVIDSRASEAGRVIRRRRECLKCCKRFTTYERMEETGRLMVIKRDGRREPFDRDKLMRAINTACGKRPISEDVRVALVAAVEEDLHREYEREVPSRAIGERVMPLLRNLDEIAYIRFASEYYQFSSAGQMMEEIKDLGTRAREVKDQAKLF